MKLGGCILGSIAVLLGLILVLLVLIKMGAIKIESYYDGIYYKKRCDSAKYFDLEELPSFTPGYYSQNLARYMMQISYNVEASNCINLEAVPIPKGFDSKTQLVGISSDGIHRPFGYIFASAKVVMIVFTGTVFVDEWIEDFDVAQVAPDKLKMADTNGILCHAGFYNIYVSVQKQIMDVISSLPGVTVYISGHSLGGALATLCAYDLAYLKPVVYTFGSPRVFNTLGASRLNDLLPENMQRVFNTEDIFTTVPLPQAFGENYEHVGANGGICFTMNLGSIPANHTDAYLKFLQA